MLALRSHALAMRGPSPSTVGATDVFVLHPVFPCDTSRRAIPPIRSSLKRMSSCTAGTRLSPLDQTGDASQSSCSPLCERLRGLSQTWVGFSQIARLFQVQDRISPAFDRPRPTNDKARNPHLFLVLHEASVQSGRLIGSIQQLLARTVSLSAVQQPLV